MSAGVAAFLTSTPELVACLACAVEETVAAGVTCRESFIICTCPAVAAYSAWSVKLAVAAEATCRGSSSFKHLCCHDSSDVRRVLTTLGNAAETLPGLVCCAVLAGVLTG